MILGVSGMSCAACVRVVEARVGLLPGIRNVRVSLLAERAEVEFDPGAVTEAQVGMIPVCRTGEG
jgi:P-type Cu+ transporter